MNDAQPGVLLEDLTWLQAEQVLQAQTVVVIPLGAASKEHGPHLRLKNDWVMAEYFKQRVLAVLDVVVAPSVTYHYYPAFVDYPGSISLRLETARDIIIDICQSLSAFGPRRFYVLNTGVSTMAALAQAEGVLAQTGILLRYTDILTVGSATIEALTEQTGGSHADEVETSMMLTIAPTLVDMTQAVAEFNPGTGAFTRTPGAHGVYSRSGVYGDATLASVAKGDKIVAAMLADILADITRMRCSPLPPAQ